MAEVRLLTEQDIPQALSVWKAVGLSEGTKTLNTFLNVDPEGTYVAVTETGEVVGTCGAIINHPDLVCVGMYSVRPSCQGKGIGSKIWKKAMEHVGERNCFLNAVPEHCDMYKDKAGFSFMSEHHSLVCQKTPVSSSTLVDEVEGVETQPITDELIDSVAKYDEDVVQYDRSTLVKSVVREEDSVALLALQGEKICGYGCLKDNIKGTCLLGPLYADNLEIAELLLRRMLENYPSAEERGLTYMGLDANHLSLKLIDKLELKCLSVLPRLHTKRIQHANYGKIYGQMNLNFCIV